LQAALDVRGLVGFVVDLTAASSGEVDPLRCPAMEFLNLIGGEGGSKLPEEVSAVQLLEGALSLAKRLHPGAKILVVKARKVREKSGEEVDALEPALQSVGGIDESSESLLESSLRQHGSGTGVRSALAPGLVQHQPVIEEALDGLDPLRLRVPGHLPLVTDPLGEEVKKPLGLDGADAAGYGDTPPLAVALLDGDHHHKGRGEDRAGLALDRGAASAEHQLAAAGTPAASHPVREGQEKGAAQRFVLVGVWVAAPLRELLEKLARSPGDSEDHARIKAAGAEFGGREVVALRPAQLVEAREGVAGGGFVEAQIAAATGEAGALLLAEVALGEQSGEAASVGARAGALRLDDQASEARVEGEAEHGVPEGGDDAVIVEGTKALE
jgi:hypothetical protein